MIVLQEQIENAMMKLINCEDLNIEQAEPAKRTVPQPAVVKEAEKPKMIVTQPKVQQVS